MIPKDHRAYRIFCLFFLLVNVFVIVGGAFVRATGSGDGCGAHWPLCHGVWLPDPHLQTLIELGHRITSSLVGIFVLILVGWTFRISQPKAPVRLLSLITMLFVLLEGLVGAVLVKFSLVAENVSLLRLVAMPFHLIFTFSLLAFATLTLFGSLQSKTPSNFALPSLKIKTKILNIILVLGFFLVAGTGALTALSDTLFKPTALNPLGQTQMLLGMQEGVHILERLRTLHPLMSVFFTAFTLYFIHSLKNQAHCFLRRVIYILTTFLVLQIVAGLVNIILFVPIYMQMVHLALACVVWIYVVLFLRFQRHRPADDCAADVL